MPSLAKTYAEQVREHFRVLFATWPPGTPLELGDVGILDGNLFIRQASLSDPRFNILFDTRSDPTNDDYRFSSEGSVSIEFSAGVSGDAGPAGDAKASMKVSFSKGQSVFLTAGDCTFDSIQDQISLGDEIMRRFQAGEWDERLAIVTTVVRAATTTVVTSSSNDASIVIEAESSAIPQVDLTDASLGLRIVSQKDLSMQIVGQGGLTPLLGLSKIQPKHILWLIRRGEEFGNLAIRSHGVPTDEMDDAPSRESGYFFGELRS